MDPALTRCIRLIGLACSIVSQHGLALSLGAVQYQSFLDEPLDAKIELLDVDLSTKTSIEVVPASLEDLARLGLERPHELATLRAEVIEQPSGKFMVRVRTDDDIRSAKLNLVLRAIWKDGAILQKYTLLLEDPPKQVANPEIEKKLENAQGDLVMLEAESTQLIEATIASTGAVSNETQAKELNEQLDWDVESARLERTEWEVAEGQKLTDIALHLRPANTVSVDQMMVAIVNKNPEVFKRGVAQELHSGQRLLVPSKEEIERVDRQQAKRSVLLSTINSAGNESSAEKQTLDARAHETKANNQAQLQTGVLRLGSSPAPQLPDETKTRGKRVQGKNFKGSRTDLGRRLDTVLARLDDANEIINNHRTEIDGLNVTIADLSYTIELKNTELAKLQKSSNDSELSSAELSQPQRATSTKQATESNRSQSAETREKEILQPRVAETNETELSQQAVKKGVLASIAAFFATIFAALTFARWRHARRQAAEYDPLSEEMRILEKAVETNKREKLDNARVASRTSISSVQAEDTVTQSKDTVIRQVEAAKTDAAKATEAKGKKANAIGRRTQESKPIEGKRANKRERLLVDNEELIDEVASEFDELAPLPWNPPSENGDLNVSFGDETENGGDTALLSKPRVSKQSAAKANTGTGIKSKTKTNVKKKTAVQTEVQQQLAYKTTAPGRELAPEGAVRSPQAQPQQSVSELDALLADDLGFGAEIEATQLETAQAYIELDDVQAALKILTEILADDSSSEHEGASRLLASIKT